MFCNFLRRKRNGDGGRGGDEGFCERAADISAKYGAIAAKMKSASGPSPQIPCGDSPPCRVRSASVRVASANRYVLPLMRIDWGAAHSPRGDTPLRGSSHFHACRFGADPAGVGHGRGVLQVARFNCRAVGRKDALDNRRPLCFSQNPASRPRIETIVRAQVARRTHFDWMKPGLASEAGRATLSRREKTPQLRFN